MCITGVILACYLAALQKQTLAYVPSSFGFLEIFDKREEGHKTGRPSKETHSEELGWSRVSESASSICVQKLL